MTDDKLYMSLTANTIKASLTNHFQRTPGGGVGVLPIMAYMGKLCPKGVPFSGFRYVIRVGISQAEVHVYVVVCFFLVYFF